MVPGRGVLGGTFMSRDGGSLGMLSAMAMYGGWCANELCVGRKEVRESEYVCVCV
jgi:hypothetical protein